jgi:ATP-dependent RNA helicase RhlE
MPAEVNRVAREALRNPKRLDLAPSTRPVECVAQAFYPVPRHLKVELLDAILDRASRGSVIVFARTKRGADRLARQLERRGHDIVVLHGDRSQSQRERALRDFRRGRSEILVATDIASRGIDVTHVTHVINFDVPLVPEDYIHRVGRTGRMNAAGDAFTLVSPEERKEAEAIERMMGHKVERLRLDDFDYHKAAEPKSREPREPRGRESRSGSHRGGATTHSRTRTVGTTATSGGEGAGAGDGQSHGRRPRLRAPDRRSRRRM